MLRKLALVGEELAVICFDTPELSASMIVDRSAESGGPGEGVLRVTPLFFQRQHENSEKKERRNVKTYERVIIYLQEGLKKNWVRLGVACRMLKEIETS